MKITRKNTANLIVAQRTQHRGRGALSNRTGRFQALVSEWEDGIDTPSPVTECRAVQARSIISRNQSPDIPFEQSINPYQGCEHGCTYCYARPTHAYLDLSPGVDFETRLTYKENAPQLLRKELGKRSYQPQCITLGANTDPYQPVDKELRLTRQLLEVLQEARHPVALITKGALVTRDLDILSEMAVDGLVSVAISITTMDPELKRLMEPRAASTAARFSAAEALSAAGIPVSVLFAPAIPALNDCDLEEILGRAADAGARSAAYMLLRLPLEIRELFYEWLQLHFPLRAKHIISLIRQSRSGHDYDSRFGHRMRGNGVFADLLSQRFKLSCKRLGLNEGEGYGGGGRTDLFIPPVPEKEAKQQIDLFNL